MFKDCDSSVSFFEFSIVVVICAFLSAAKYSETLKVPCVFEVLNLNFDESTV